LNNGQRVQNLDRDHYCDERYAQIRWLFHSNSATSEDYESILFDGFTLFAQAFNYFTNDIGVRGLTASPFSGEAEEQRTITATIYNYGDKDAADYEVNFKVTNKDTDQLVHNETVTRQDLAYETSEDVSITWTPEDEGEYYINVTTLFEDRWGANLDEDSSNDFRSVMAKAEYSFARDDMEGGMKAWWSNGTVDLDGNGAHEALAQWELGTPDYEGGPQTVPSGSNCWATVLDGNHGDYGRDGAYLELDVDLANARKPVLNLWHWAEVEGQGFDSVFIRAGEVTSRGEVEEWSTLWENSPEGFDIYKTDGWEGLVVPLFDEENDAYDFSFSHINLQFILMADSNVNYAGWYLDDVTIGGQQPPARDASLDAILTPVNGTAIPPGTLVRVNVKVSNVGSESQNIPVNLYIEDQDGFELFDNTKTTSSLNPGSFTILSWDWNVAVSSGELDYIATATTKLSNDEQSFNDEKWIIIRPKVVHDMGVMDLYASPLIQDINKPRKVTVELKNWGNVDETDVLVTITAKDSKFGGTRYRKSKEIYTDIFAGDTTKVIWEWKADKYANYDLEALVELYDAELEEYYADDEDTTSKYHENQYTVAGKAFTVKKILSVTVDEGPTFDGEPKEDFWDEGNSDVETDGLSMGWHALPTGGHNSEMCWYAGIPDATPRRYTNKADVTLVSTPVPLNEKFGAILRFYTKFDIEGRYYDNLYVYMKANDENPPYDDWQLVKKYPEQGEQNSVNWADSVNGWVQFEFDLEDIFQVENMTAFQLMFRFRSDADVFKEGVYIDDISIYAMTTENSAPFTRFIATADWDRTQGPVTAYSQSIIDNPPDEFADLALTPADNILPRAEEGKQGGIPLDTKVTFDATSTIDPDLEDIFDDLEFQWDFGDGTTHIDDGDAGAVTEHAYDADAVDGFAETDTETGKRFFPITLTVEDSSGDISTDTLRVFIGNEPPVAEFNIYSGDLELTDDVDPVPGNSYLDIFYGDVIELSEHAFDAEGSINPATVTWTFEGGPVVIGESKIKFTVGGNVQYIGKTGVVLGPVFGDAEPTTPTEYTLTLAVNDLSNARGEKTVYFRVHPYASKTYPFQVRDANNNDLEPWVQLKWRGFTADAVTTQSAWEVGKVYVGLSLVDAEVPKNQLPSNCWLDLNYKLEVYGPKLQTGKEGFASITLHLPFTRSSVEQYGVFDTLKGDVAAYRFDKVSKRYGPTGDNNLADLTVKDAGTALEGTIDYSHTLFTAKSVTRADEKYLEMDMGLAIKTIWTREKLPDLELTNFDFDHNALIIGNTVNLTATITNKGNIYINEDVMVRFLGNSGETLADFTVTFTKEDEQVQQVTYAYFIDERIGEGGYTEAAEHTLNVKVDADLDIDEINEDNNIYYRDGNKPGKLLPVVEYKPDVVTSFGLSSLLLTVSVMMVTFLAVVVKEHKRRKTSR